MEFDFAQNAQVPSLERVPQDFRGLYKEVESDDGDKMFALDTENPSVKSAVAAISGLNSALRAARSDLKTIKSQQPDLTPLKDYGDTPEVIAQKINERIQGLQEQIKGVNVDKIRADLEKPWQEKLSAAEEAAKRVEQSFHDRVVVGEAKAAIATNRGDPDLLLPFVLQSCRVTRNSDGGLDVVVVDEAGDIRHSGITGKPMSISERVAEMKAQEKFGKLFESEAPAGGGTPPNNRFNPPTGRQPNAAELSPNEKIARGLAKGQALRK